MMQILFYHDLFPQVLLQLIFLIYQPTMFELFQQVSQNLPFAEFQTYQILAVWLVADETLVKSPQECSSLVIHLLELPEMKWLIFNSLENQDVSFRMLIEVQMSKWPFTKFASGSPLADQWSQCTSHTCNVTHPCNQQRLLYIKIDGQPWYALGQLSIQILS